MLISFRGFDTLKSAPSSNLTSLAKVLGNRLEEKGGSFGSYTIFGFFVGILFSHLWRDPFQLHFSILEGSVQALQVFLVFAGYFCRGGFDFIFVYLKEIICSKFLIFYYNTILCFQ